MTSFLFTFLGLASVCWLAARARETRGGFLRETACRFLSLLPAEKAFLLLFAAALCIRGGSKTNAPAGAPQQPESYQSPIINLQSPFPDLQSLIINHQSSISNSPSLTPGQYAAGFALVSVSTNAAPWPAAPSNAAAHPPWAVYAAAED
ncbi:MAG: hypothetical protein PHE10_06550, partial [Kiritimatiellae bacterium]|nr:hypothetical protein [Kiritimatiellia bacterium]